MNVQVRELSPIVREVQVELPPEVVAAELDRIYKGLRQRAKVPGFRPGHVPRNVLERRFGAEVNVEAASHLVTTTLADALRDASVQPVAEPVVQKDAVSPGASFRYTLRCEVKPSIDPSDYFEVEVEGSTVSVRDEDLAAELERLRESRSELRPVEGRDVVQHGDFLVLDFDASVDGQPFDGGVARDRLLQIGSRSAIPGFEEKLVGAVRGAPVELTLDLPADLGNKKIAGKRALFRVKVSEIKERFVPALDDDFAKEVGGGETLDELKGKLRTELERRARDRADREVKERIVDAILGRTPFDVPPSLVEAELESGMREARLSLAMMGVDPSGVPLDERRMRRELRPRAERRARQRLLLEAVAEKEGVAVSDEEVEGAIRRHAEATGQALSKVRQGFLKPERKERLRAQIREEKVLDLLRSRARIKKTGSAEESGAQAG
jgi:trigger factor